ncbi:hypothetical protein BLFGPEAP_01386 [Candidatus Methanoperedenaceae archaeon GB50]|nr:hypothetical protein BLFGPEAP_01386 [Candidatus Methanoperedenaceae archaeon GB50]
MSVLSFKPKRPETWVEIDRKKATSLGLNVAYDCRTGKNLFLWP